MFINNAPLKCERANCSRKVYVNGFEGIGVNSFKTGCLPVVNASVLYKAFVVTHLILVNVLMVDLEGVGRQLLRFVQFPIMGGKENNVKLLRIQRIDGKSEIIGESDLRHSIGEWQGSVGELTPLQRASVSSGPEGDLARSRFTDSTG